MYKPLICAVLTLLASGGLVAAERHELPHAPWSYSGNTAAAHWGDLKPDYATCKQGRMQSPIDIRDATTASLAAIEFDYARGAAEVVNNGHTIQVNPAAGGEVTLAAGKFKLLQLHFHTPSEETIDGKAFPLEAHLVHRNAAGELAVIAVMFQEGRENPVLAQIFNAMPRTADQKAALGSELNPADLLPAQHDYYAYMGSLTTPPCSEGVYWQVLKQPLEMSRAQLTAFRKLYPMNARPVQPLNDRTVEQN